MTQQTFDRLKNRIECMNTLNAAFNKVIIAIRKDIAEHGMKLTKDGALYKKDKERLQTVITSCNVPEAVSYWFTYSAYTGANITLKSSYAATAPDSRGCQCHAYLEQNYWIGSSETDNVAREFTPLELVDLEHAREVESQLPKLIEQRNNLDSLIRQHLRLVSER